MERNYSLHGTVDLGKITVRNHLGWLIADANLEASWAPVNELDGPLGLEGGNSSVDILGDNVTTIQETSSHVLSIAGIALHHLIVGLEAGHGDLLDRVGLVGGLGSRHNRGVSNKREMDTWIRHQVSLELIEINIKRTIETERSSD
jgi:hypothetical protein